MRQSTTLIHSLLTHTFKPLWSSKASKSNLAAHLAKAPGVYCDLKRFPQTRTPDDVATVLKFETLAAREVLTVVPRSFVSSKCDIERSTVFLMMKISGRVRAQYVFNSRSRLPNYWMTSGPCRLPLTFIALTSVTRFLISFSSRHCTENYLVESCIYDSFFLNCYMLYNYSLSLPVFRLLPLWLHLLFAWNSFLLPECRSTSFTTLRMLNRSLLWVLRMLHGQLTRRMENCLEHNSCSLTRPWFRLQVKINVTWLL